MMRIGGRYNYAMLTYFKGSHFLLFTTPSCLIMELLELSFAENDTVNMIDFFFISFTCFLDVRPMSFSDLIYGN